LLGAMLEFFPLDTFVENPVSLMKTHPGASMPSVWLEYEKIIKGKDFKKAFSGFNMIERMEYYDYAKEAYAIVQTGMTAHYANIGLQKGVI